MCFMHGKSLAGLSSSCRLRARLPGWVTMGAEGTEPVYTQSGAPAQTLGLSPRRLTAGHIDAYWGICHKARWAGGKF